MEKKFTLKEKFEMVMAFIDGQETELDAEALKEFCAERIALIDSKASSSKSKKADAHKAYDEMVLATISDAEDAMTVSEMMTTFDELSMAKGNSISGVTHALKRLADKGLVVNVKEGGKSYYKVVE